MNEFLLFATVFFASMVGFQFIRASLKKSRQKYPPRNQWPQKVKNETKAVYEAYQRVTQALPKMKGADATRALSAEIYETADQLLALAYQTGVKKVEFEATLKDVQKHEQTAAQLELRHAQSSSIDERESLYNSLASYQKILRRMPEIENARLRCDTSMREIEAALIEMHSQVVASGSSMSLEFGSEDGSLRENLTRIRQLSQTIEESQQVFARTNLD